MNGLNLSLVIWKYFYDVKSASKQATMYQPKKQDKSSESHKAKIQPQLM